MLGLRSVAARSSSSRILTTRCLAAMSTSTSNPSSPIVELRQYQLHPAAAATYTKNTIQSSDLRKNLPLAFFGFPETGSIALNTAVHLYHYPEGTRQRKDERAALAKKDEWKQYLGGVKECMMQQKSEIFVEAGLVQDFEQVTGLEYWIKNDGSLNSDGESIVELRKYQLKLGYDTVPNFLKLYAQVLPSKLNAIGTHPTTQLVTILVSDVGSLNTVYEVWKHGGESSCGMEAMEQSRQASRGAKEWRTGIAEIAQLATSFDTTILKPAAFSPLQ
mmetsp:Transcript_14301/g.29194  ORF Transcript_14301/g.29194 Transcript_14301/m.29194 type:complete len:275 (+) Transcript_14301:52-876(+)